MDLFPVLRDPRFKQAFFDYMLADAIDVTDQKAVLSSAQVTVLVALQRGVPDVEIISELTYALDNWGDEVIDAFSQANDGDWGFNIYHETLLKAAVEAMLSTARTKLVYSPSELEDKIQPALALL